MTPAKLMVLVASHRDRLAITELPIANFMALFYNMNRDPGDTKTGRPPADARRPEDFQVFGKRKKTLAAKDDKPGGRHNLDGARSDRGGWSAWAASKTKQTVRLKAK